MGSSASAANSLTQHAKDASDRDGCTPVAVPRVEFEKLTDRRAGERSAEVRQRVRAPDLAGADVIAAPHLAEALQYRPRAGAEGQRILPY